MSKWDEDVVKSLANRLDQKDSANMLPLHHAIKQKAPLNIIESLINGYKDALSMRDVDGKLPLHYAAERNLPIEYFQVLLTGYTRGVRERDDKGMIPLHHLVRFCTDVNLVKLLMSHFPESVREKDKDGWLPLHFAARDNSSCEIIEHLVLKYAGGLCEKSNHGSLPMHCAAHYNNNTHILQYLADQYPSSLSFGGNKGMWPIHCAVRNNPCIEISKLLIKLNPSSVSAEDEERRLPLHHSIRNMSISIIKYLIDLYPYALRVRDANGWLPIHTAARFSMNMEVVGCLVSHYPQGLQVLDEEDWLPLHHAARTNLSLDVIKFLIKQFPEGLLYKAVSVDKYVHELPPDRSDKKVFLSLLYTALNRESVQALGVLRMHIIGDAYAGKTVCSKWVSSLISANLLAWQNIELFDTPMDISPHERTRGMETTHLEHSMTVTDNKVTHYLIHDYAGQEEYLGNHANFLNVPDSMYILVLPVFDKQHKQRISLEKIIERAVYWLRFVFASTKLYPNGRYVCIVMNTFVTDVKISTEELFDMRRKVLNALRKLFTFVTYAEHVGSKRKTSELQADGSIGSSPVMPDFILVGNEILLIDARMKNSAKMLIDHLRVAAHYHVSTSLSRQSRLQAYCWDLLNMLDLSIVMREEDLHFMVMSTVKSFFSKALSTYLMMQGNVNASTHPEVSEEQLQLLKEMKVRDGAVQQAESLLCEYILEILVLLGKILIVKQQRSCAGHLKAGEHDDSSSDSVVITAPQGLSHKILGYLYGNLASFTGREQSPSDLILRTNQLQLMLTYLPPLPVSLPRLLVLLGVCIPVKVDGGRVKGVYDPPEYNVNYVSNGSSSSSGSTSANYSSPYVQAYNQRNGGGASNSNKTTSATASAVLPPPSADEKMYWVIGLIQRSVRSDEPIVLHSALKHLLPRCFLLSSRKCLFLPSLLPKLFAFIYSLLPDSEELRVYRDGMSILCKEEAGSGLEAGAQETSADEIDGEREGKAADHGTKRQTEDQESSEGLSSPVYTQVVVYPHYPESDLQADKNPNQDGFYLVVGSSRPASCLSLLQKLRRFLCNEIWNLSLDEQVLLQHPASVLAGGQASMMAVAEAEDLFFCPPPPSSLTAHPMLHRALFGYALSEEDDEGERDVEGEVLSLSVHRTRPLPLLPPYSTFSTAIEEVSRCLLLSTAQAVGTEEVKRLLLARMRDIGVT
ncbi:ankyrin repeat domain-containing protein, partial [archaeon]